MPKYAYTSKQAPVVAPTFPDIWPPGWFYPLPDDGPWADDAAPWPPGWPLDPPNDPDNPGDEYTLTVTVPATIYLAETIVTANAFTQAPAPAAFLNNHTMRMTATINGLPLKMSKTLGGALEGELWYRMTNHDGINYGISESVFFDVGFGEHGGTIAVTVSIVTVAPHITDSDTGLLDMTCPYVPWPGVAPAILTIEGYVDGMIGACAGCNAQVGNAWDGTFTPWFAFSCHWRGDDSKSIDGKDLREANVVLTAGVWGLAIFCFALPLALNTWTGTKIGGATPFGVYTRNGGCDLTPSLTII